MPAAKNVLFSWAFAERPLAIDRTHASAVQSKESPSPLRRRRPAKKNREGAAPHAPRTREIGWIREQLRPRASARLPCLLAAAAITFLPPRGRSIGAMPPRPAALPSASAAALPPPCRLLALPRALLQEKILANLTEQHDLAALSCTCGALYRAVVFPRARVVLLSADEDAVPLQMSGFAAEKRPLIEALAIAAGGLTLEKLSVGFIGAGAGAEAEEPLFSYIHNENADSEVDFATFWPRFPLCCPARPR